MIRLSTTLHAQAFYLPKNLNAVDGTAARRLGVLALYEAMIRDGERPFDAAHRVGVPRPTLIRWQHALENSGHDVSALSEARTRKAVIRLANAKGANR